MEIAFTIVGIGCLAWTVAELAAAASRLPPLARFGVVDPEDGRVLDVVVDPGPHHSRIRALR